MSTPQTALAPIERTLDELGAQLSLVEAHHFATEGELRAHLLGLHRRLEEVETALDRTTLTRDEHRRAVERVLEVERRLERQENQHADLASLRAETIARVDSHQRQLTELQRLREVLPRLEHELHGVAARHHELLAEMEARFATLDERLRALHQTVTDVQRTAAENGAMLSQLVDRLS